MPSELRGRGALRRYCRITAGGVHCMLVTRRAARTSPDGAAFAPVFSLRARMHARVRRVVVPFGAMDEYRMTQRKCNMFHHARSHPVIYAGRA